MKLESIVLSVLTAATTVVQAMPVHTHSIDHDANASLPAQHLFHIINLMNDAELD